MALTGSLPDPDDPPGLDPAVLRAVAAACSPTLEEVDAAWLLDHRADAVVGALARNPATPSRILEGLTHDADREVAADAAATLRGVVEGTALPSRASARGLILRLRGRGVRWPYWLGQSLDIGEDGIRRIGTMLARAPRPVEPLTAWTQVHSLRIDVEGLTLAVHAVNGSDTVFPVHPQDRETLRRIEPLQHQPVDHTAPRDRAMVAAVAEARRNAYRMWELLGAHGGAEAYPTFRRVLGGILGELDAVPDELTARDALRNADDLLRPLLGGMGSLNDIVLWVDDDQAATNRVNDEFTAARNRLADLLRAHRRG